MAMVWVDDGQGGGYLVDDGTGDPSQGSGDTQGGNAGNNPTPPDPSAPDPSAGTAQTQQGTTANTPGIPGGYTAGTTISPSMLASLGSALGLSPSSLSSLMPLLAGLAPLLGGLYSANKTNQATGQVVQGINNANTAITGLLGPTSSGGGVYAPYTQLGAGAAANLPGLGFKGVNIPGVQTSSPGAINFAHLATSQAPPINFSPLATSQAPPINFSTLAGNPALTLGKMAGGK